MKNWRKILEEASTTDIISNNAKSGIGFCTYDPCFNIYAITISDDYFIRD